MKNTQSSPSFRNLLWLLGSVLKVTPWLATGWFLTSLIMAGVSASELLVLRETVNTLVASESWHTSVPWLVMLCLLFFTQHAITVCLPLLREQLRINVGYALQHAALEKIGKLPLEAFDEEDSHNLINRVAVGSDTRSIQLIENVLALIEILPTLLTSIVILGMMSIWVALSVFIGTLLLRYYEIQMGARVRHFEVENIHEKRLSDYYTQLLTQRESAAEVRLWGIGDILRHRWRETTSGYLNLQLRVSFKNTSQGLLHTFGFTTFLATALLIITRTQGSIEPGLAALVLNALWNVTRGMNSLQQYVIMAVQHAGYGEDLHRLIEGFEVEETPATPTRKRPYSIQDGIRLKNVSYRYPSAETDALHNINLNVRAGEILAIVGTNGAGKTTLAHLLAGLRPPTQGQILIDDTDITILTPEAHRRVSSMVFQHPTHYPASLADNIKLSANQIPEAHLESILTRVGLSDRRFSLKKFLGPEFGGVDLSGGEWQHIAIARCLIKKETQFVIFDEPTAALDPLAEMRIFEQFIKLVDGRTAVLIAHRLGPTRFADRVAVLENGHLVEIGTPRELLTQKSRYAHMFATQREWYK